MKSSWLMWLSPCLCRHGHGGFQGLQLHRGCRGPHPWPIELIYAPFLAFLNRSRAAEGSALWKPMLGLPESQAVGSMPAPVRGWSEEHTRTPALLPEPLWNRHRCVKIEQRFRQRNDVNCSLLLPFTSEFGYASFFSVPWWLFLKGSLSSVCKALSLSTELFICMWSWVFIKIFFFCCIFHILVSLIFRAE